MRIGFAEVRHPLLLSSALALLLAGCPSAPRGDRLADPEIASIAPRSGPRTGGNVVRVEGSGFGSSPFVTLGGADVQEFVLVTDRAIEFVAPADVIGPAALSVFNASGGRRTVVDAYFFEPLPARSYAGRYFADSPDLAGANVVVVSTAGTISGLDLSVSALVTGEIAGLLRDGSGAPVVGHAVVAQRADGSFPPIAFPSGLDGAYRIPGLAPGAWYVRTAAGPDSLFPDQAWNASYDLATATAVSVNAGGTTEDVDFTLLEGATITGEVSSAITGAGVDGVTVFALSVPSDSLRFAYAVTAGTNGTFAMRGLAPGDYQLVAFSFGTGLVNEYFEESLTPAGATLVTVSSGTAAVADFVLDEAGSISGSVVEDGELGPLPYVSIFARDIDRGLVHSSSTGVDGTYLLQGLPPGNYQLEAPELGQFLGGFPTGAGSPIVVVTAGVEVADQNFLGRLGEEPCADPASHGTVSGLVLGAGGAKVLRATIFVSPVNGGETAVATSGLDGRYTAGCVVPGEYEVQVFATNTDLVTQAWPGGVTVTAGNDVIGVDFALARGAKLEGRVRDAATNATLANVPVRVTSQSTGVSRTTVTGPDGRWSADRTSAGGLGAGNWTMEARPHVQQEFAAP